MRPKVFRDVHGTVWIQRFSAPRRAEHWLAVITFVVLVLTGFPQKFYDTAWAQWVIAALGDLSDVRFVHRIAGWVFSFHAVLHLLWIVVGWLSRRIRLTLLPLPRDLRDLWQTISYDLGFRDRPPELPKFDYRQKFEYVGLVLGGLVMVASGLILIYPSLTASLLPGEVIPAARVAHSSEALLALSVLIVWHIYGAVLSPAVFPLDRVIITGCLPAEELYERHALEYRALFGVVPPHELDVRGLPLLEDPAPTVAPASTPAPRAP